MLSASFQLIEHIGDPLPLSILKYKPAPGIAIDEHEWPEHIKDEIKSVSVEQWLDRHPYDHVELLLDRLVAAVRSNNAQTEFLGVGYCFGGKHVLRMAKKHLRAVASFHPVRWTSTPGKLSG